MFAHLPARLLVALFMPLLLPLLLCLAPAVSAAPDAMATGETRIRLTMDGESLSATVEDNAAGRDFLQMLPLTLHMKDYNATEKIADLPGKLATQGMPAGFAPEVGDITVYAPWGNLAIFYREFSWSQGLFRLGRVTSGLETLARRRGAFTVTIERAE